MARFLCVAPDLVEALRPALDPFIVKVIKHRSSPPGERGYTLDDVWDGLRSGQFLMWVAEEGLQVKSIGVTGLYRNGNGLYCHVIFCAGKLDLILRGLPELEDFARREGCKRVRLSGRRGWERIFRDYELVASIYPTFEKVL